VDRAGGAGLGTSAIITPGRLTPPRLPLGGLVMGIRYRFDNGRMKVRNTNSQFGGVDYGSSLSEIENSTANQKFIALYHKSTATSGDNRTIYARLNLAGVTAGAGYGDCIRAWAKVSGTGYAYACGVHSTLSVDAGATVTGAGAGLRATIGAAAASRTLSGALAAINADSDIGANNTMPSIHGFIRFTNSGSVALSNLLVLPSAAGNGTIFAAHDTQVMTHSIRILDSAGTAYYVMCTNAATNRS